MIIDHDAAQPVGHARGRIFELPSKAPGATERGEPLTARATAPKGANEPLRPFKVRARTGAGHATFCRFRRPPVRP